jgi:LysM repeat protein
MLRKLIVVLIVCLIIMGSNVTLSYAQGGWVYTVQPQDTLISIAVRYNVNVNELATANQLYWNSNIYAGQQLTIPGSVTIQPRYAPNNAYTSGQNNRRVAPTSPTGYQTHVVRTGDTLTNISTRYGVSIQAIQQANDLTNIGYIYNGQRLIIPTQSTNPINQPVAQSLDCDDKQSEDCSTNFPTPAEIASRWIYVDLSEQRLTAYQGVYPVFSTMVSTGLPQHPTVVGDFNIYVKYESTRMQGGYGADYYDLANVPHTMYFYGGYALHGAYWHNDFGTPRSHGCVNLPLPVAEWLYSWATVGTKVVVRE